MAMLGFEVTEIAPWQEGSESWRGLRARFPDEIASHSNEQDFYFGDHCLPRRHDYHVDVAGGFPTAQYVHDIGDNKRDRVSLSIPRRYTRHRDRHYLAGGAGSGDLRTLRASPRWCVAQDLRDQRGACSLSECVRFNRPGVPEDTGPERNRSDAERPGIQDHSTRGFNRVRRPWHCRGDKIP